MNNTKLPSSLDDTTELRKLILENPDAPLVIFAGEEAWCDNYYYKQVDAHGIALEELTIYKDYWQDKDDYIDNLRDDLADDLADDEKYNDLSDKEFDELIDKRVTETEFIKAIVVYVG